MHPAISFGAYLSSLPLQFLLWWFVEATFTLFKIMRFSLAAAYHLLGTGSLIKTFFKPWKNEYREGLVRFSILMGMFMKTMLLIFDLFFFSLLILTEFILLLGWILLPLIVLGGVYAAIFS